VEIWLISVNWFKRISKNSIETVYLSSGQIAVKKWLDTLARLLIKEKICITLMKFGANRSNGSRDIAKLV